ncbi:MAG: hypothetical protein QHC90_13335 [Shinella sp.]|nr:hypothetical protein [Shinella sp.]
MQFNCAHCGKEADRPAGHVNRARAQGLNLYCSRLCSGLGRRNGKTIEERKEAKRLYDIEYRARDPEGRKASKAAYYQRTKDPVKEAAKRKERMPFHVEYCRRPEYRAKKKVYDRQYRAHKHYGDFAECFLLVMDIRDECLSRMTDYEIRLEKGTLNKALKRKRDDQRAYSNSPENGPLGNLERGEGGQNGRLSRGRDRLSGSGNPSHHEHSVAGSSAS